MVSRNIDCLQDQIPPQNGTVPQLMPPMVTIKQGQIKGFNVEDFLGGFLQVFLGIPYASPPVGDLRFKPPEDASSWSGTMDATQLKAACPQSLSELPRRINYTSEDCLYLNVYAPIRTGNSTLSLPVMVYIHHGSLQSGAAGIYDMKNLAAYGQVVVVEFNYRLGPLGFLSTLDVNAPGNVGFLDMCKGLQWIRDNIQSFGGDPNSVTLFGHGAGGLAVNYLLLSPLTRGLFHKAISSSGNALVTGSIAKPGDYYSDPLVATQELAKALDCPVDNNVKMVGCLRTKPAESLLDAPVPRSKYGVKFPPVIDGVFLQEPPWDSLLKGNYMEVPYIIGLTNDEEGAELANLLGNDNGIATETYHKMVLEYASAHFRYNPGQIADVIGYSYRDFSHPNDPKALRNGFRDLVQDHKWLAPSYQLADQHSTRADTFLYIYSHPASSSGNSSWIGASHLDDLLYLFGDPVAKNPTQEYNEMEKQMSLRLMAYWTNFAHNGNPNRGPHRISSWPKYTVTNREFVNFTADTSDWTGNSYRGQQTAFWNRIALKMQSVEWCNENGPTPLPVNTTATVRPTTTQSPELCNGFTQDILSMNLTAEEIITAFYVAFALLFVEAFLILGLLYKLYMQQKKLRKLQGLLVPSDVPLKGIIDENKHHTKF
ncbi:carboxylesterase 5A-like [Pristis pectinata]|uniref:carboxylesterase 5A-like n=1 Tax=Pristis pectinata TaxID=685728 RepID=UPI00223D4B36|nr:carboxylesterase 5A-like [Pristis pectinata]